MDFEPRDLEERIAQLTATRAWPWMKPGVLSVGLDDQGRLVRYMATDSALVPVGIEDVGSDT